MAFSQEANSFSDHNRRGSAENGGHYSTGGGLYAQQTYSLDDAKSDTQVFHNTFLNEHDGG